MVFKQYVAVQHNHNGSMVFVRCNIAMRVRELRGRVEVMLQRIKKNPPPRSRKLPDKMTIEAKGF